MDGIIKAVTPLAAPRLSQTHKNHSAWDTLGSSIFWIRNGHDPIWIKLTKIQICSIHLSGHGPCVQTENLIKRTI
jgi:hypothetical protein